jgi:hypothetical protein
VSHNGHDDIATRLRREASTTAPERLRADVMLRVRAEPRPQRIQPRRSFGRAFATVAAAACVLGALAFGASRVDLGGGGSASGGGSTSAQKALEFGGGAAAGGDVAPEPAYGSAVRRQSAPSRLTQDVHKAAATLDVPGPLRGAVYGRAQLAVPLRHTFGALDPYHQRARP